MRHFVPVFTAGFLIYLFANTSLLNAQNLDSLLQNKRVYTAVSVLDMQLPKIDGVLDDEIWKQGEWQGDFTQQQPYGGGLGSEATFIKVLYDFSNLYVAIICEDENPELIRDFLDRRDALSGDMTGIAIDSYNDKRTAFEFNLSAGGQKMDLKHLGDYQWDMNWDGVWDGATGMVDSGWVAEMRIPFSQIRYSNDDEHLWGMHVWRWIDRKKEEDQWQYIPLEAPAMVYLFGELKGIENIRSSRQVEFLPYALGSLSPDQAGGGYDFDYNGGLDAKIGISSDYTLDLSVNPDFGQVEADPSQLNLTSFEVFYDEKRPFFLEGNDVFDFSLDEDIPYYSRRIGSAPIHPGYSGDYSLEERPDRTTILSAAKITGKNRNGLSVGVMNGLTARQFGKAQNSEGEEMNMEVAPLSNYLASRVKKEFKEGTSSIGGYVSSVNRFSGDQIIDAYLPSQALTGGVDFLHQWDNRNYFVEGKVIGSQLLGSEEAILRKQLSNIHRFQRPDAGYLSVDSSLTRFQGSGGLIRGGKKGGNWNFAAESQYRSPGLNLNDMGYIRQSDFISERIEASYKMNEPTKRIRNYKVNLYQEAAWTFGKELGRSRVGGSYVLTNIRLWTLGATATYSFPHFDTRELRGGPALWNDAYYNAFIHLSSNRAKDFYGSIVYSRTGSGNDFFTQDNIHASLTWLPMKRIKLSTRLNLSSFDYGQQFVTNRGTNGQFHSIVGWIDRKTASLTLRGEVFFTPEISLQYYGNPYYSVGEYNDFRWVKQPDGRKLEDRFESLEIDYSSDDASYSYTHNNVEYSFGEPDFSYIQYRSNLVFRWEFKPGSTFYLVWSQDRSDWRSEYNPIADIGNDIFGLTGSNVFMMKLNYWFSL